MRFTYLHELQQISKGKGGFCHGLFLQTLSLFGLPRGTKPYFTMLDYKFDFPPAAGIRRYPSSGTDVLIIGGGIGGLFAAVNCWQKGHDVRILEAGTRYDRINGILLTEYEALDWQLMSYRRFHTYLGLG